MRSTSGTVLLTLVVILTFPIWIGIAGGLIGLAVGIIGGVFGAMVGIFGAIFGAIAGAIGSVFDVFNWPFHSSHFPHSIIRNLLFLGAIIFIAAMISRSQKKGKHL